MTLPLLLLATPALADPLPVADGPRDLAATYDAASEAVVLTWDPPASAGPDTVYSVYREGDFLGAVLQSSFTDDDLPVSATWTYTVTATSSGEAYLPAHVAVLNGGYVQEKMDRKIIATYSPSDPPAIGPPPRPGFPCTLMFLGVRSDPYYLFALNEDCLDNFP